MGFGTNHPRLAETLALLILGALFFMLAAAAIATGVSAYRGATRVIDENNVYRTALAYIGNQIRRADSAGGVEVVALPWGGNALAVSEQNGYCTYIYSYGGWLRELYTEKGFDLQPGAGIELMALDRVFFGSTASGQIIAAIDSGGVVGYVALTPRSHGQIGVVLP